ncbi:adhesion G-protein coupled receptor G7-like, partial [Clarias magur]
LTNGGNQPSLHEQYADSSDTFSANRIKMNDKLIPLSDQFPIDLQMNIKLKE